MRWLFYAGLFIILFALNANAAILIQSANGTYVANQSISTLALARLQPNPILITSALSAEQSNISSDTVHSWGSTPITVAPGASINNTTLFSVATINADKTQQIFGGTGTVTGLYDATPEWFGAGTTSDDQPAIQRAVNAALRVEFLPRIYTLKNSVYILNACSVFGAGMQRTYLMFWGSNGFVISPPGYAVSIRDMEIRAYDSVGVVDPHLNTGIWMNGTSLQRVYNIDVQNVSLQGWGASIGEYYTNNSTLHNIYTSNCLFGIHVFGQSINNNLSDSFIYVDPTIGASAFYQTPDPSNEDTAEGYIIANTVLAYGSTTINATRLLALQLLNNVIDLSSETDVYLENCAAATIIGNWIGPAASAIGIHLTALSVDVEQGTAIIGNHILASGGGNGMGILIGDRNIGITIIGNHVEDAWYPIYVDTLARSVVVSSNVIKNTGPNFSITVSGLGNSVDGNLGDASIYWGQSGSERFTTTVTINPGVVSPRYQSGNIEMSDAVLGEACIVYPPYDLQGATATCYVRAKNMVVINITAPAEGVTLGSGAWKVKVLP